LVYSLGLRSYLRVKPAVILQKYTFYLMSDISVVKNITFAPE